MTKLERFQSFFFVFPLNIRRFLSKSIIFIFFISSVLTTIVITENYSRISLSVFLDQELEYFPEYVITGEMTINDSWEDTISALKNQIIESINGSILHKIDYELYFYSKLDFCIYNSSQVSNKTNYSIWGLENSSLELIADNFSINYPTKKNDVILLQGLSSSAKYLNISDSFLFGFNREGNKIEMNITSREELDFSNISLLNTLPRIFKYGERTVESYLDLNNFPSETLELRGLREIFNVYYTDITQGSIIFFTSVTFLKDLLFSEFNRETFPIRVDICFDRSSLASILYSKLVSTDIKFQRTMTDKLNSEVGLESYGIQSALGHKLFKLRAEFERFFLIFLILLVFPLLGTFFLSKFLNDFFNQKREKTLKLFIQRGASIFQIFISLIIEITLLVCIGFLGGILLSQLSTPVLLSSQHILNFGSVYPVDILSSLPSLLFLLIFFWIIAILSNIDSFLWVVTNFKNKPIQPKDPKPFFLRHHYHYLLLILGLLGYIFIEWIKTGLTDFNVLVYYMELRGLSFYQSIFLLLIVFGLILSLPQLIIWIIQIFSFIFAKSNKLILFLAFKAFNKRAKIIYSSSLFIAIIFMIITVAIVFPVNQLENEEFYTTTRLGGHLMWQTTTISDNYTHFLDGLEEINSSSPFSHLQRTSRGYHFLAINFSRYFEMLNLIFKDSAPKIFIDSEWSTTENICLMQKHALNDMNIQLGEALSIPLLEDNLGEPIYVEMRVIGYYDWFPRIFFDDSQNHQIGNLLIPSYITNFHTITSMLEIFQNTSFKSPTYTIESGYLISTNSGIDDSLIKEKIRNFSAGEPTIISSNDLINLETGRWRIFFILSNFILIFSVLFIILGLFLFFIRLNFDRIQELVIENIFGLDGLAFFLVTIGPVMILYFLSSLGGFIFGSLIASALNSLIPYLLHVQSIKIPLFTVPWEILVFIGVLSLFLLICYALLYFILMLRKESPILILQKE
ncbi:MAG: hypothetical protein ACFFAU_19925 [Candidatus Hodarchaeota archaeon]